MLCRIGEDFVLGVVWEGDFVQAGIFFRLAADGKRQG